MEENFEEFLDEINHPEIEGDLPDLPEDITGDNVEEEEESKSVSRFKSLENSPPSLSSLCIFRVCSWMNEMTCDPANNKVVHDTFHDKAKMLPQEVQEKIRTQLSMTALKCIYEHRVWDLEPHVIAAGIKQEEDMIRYLYWKQPNNPLLKHFEKTLVIKLFEDDMALDLISNTKLPPTGQLKEALVQSYMKECFSFRYVSKPEFKANFKQMTNGCLKKLNWNNVLVVGGSVLKSLRKDKRPNVDAMLSNDNRSDIDIYLYRLTNEQAQAKVEEIFNSVQSCWNEQIGIFKTANTITLVSGRKFRSIQIILSTYASPLEILMASDMNSCSIGFNGRSVLVIPRFLLGSIYGSNILDSSTKFGTKLRWERLAKYYKRGYNIASPLYVRVHGHGAFSTHEKITPKVHPNTYQMIELMCLMKIVLTRAILHRETILDIYGWKIDWLRGLSIEYRSTARKYRNNTEFNHLRQLLPKLPHWVQEYYLTRQDLSWLKTGVREPPRYAEDHRTIDKMEWSNDPSLNYDPSKTSDIHKYVQDHCKFDQYNDSSLQCFHLNFFVDKEQTVVNPYKEMNTSLVTVNYRHEVFQHTFTMFDDFLAKKFQTISKTFKMFNYNWKLSLDWGSKDVSFISLTKEEDDENEQSSNNAQYHPTKFFVNFFIKIKNQKKLANENEPKDLIYDGSHVFTHDKPDNMWLTWAHNKYFKGIIPSMDYDNYEYRDQLCADLQYIENGNTHWEVVMQLIEPQFNIQTM